LVPFQNCEATLSGRWSAFGRLLRPPVTRSTGISLQGLVCNFYFPQGCLCKVCDVNYQIFLWNITRFLKKKAKQGQWAQGTRRSTLLTTRALDDGTPIQGVAGRCGAATVGDGSRLAATVVALMLTVQRISEGTHNARYTYRVLESVELCLIFCKKEEWRNFDYILIL
jgi:hypothetical protein